jgi:EAL domain-containing protein (putative c-di-GMP-specific phosphodiesterase class I)
MGCDRAQGYLISRAMPAADVPVWFEKWNRQHAVAG